MAYILTINEKIDSSVYDETAHMESSYRKIQNEVHENHIASGDIISADQTDDGDLRTTVIKYKDEDTARSIFAELESHGVLLSRPDGITILSTSGEVAGE